jgi:hypothetical protein
MVSQYQRNPDSEDTRCAVHPELIDLLNEKHEDYGLGHALAADFYILTGDEEKTITALNRTTETMPLQ